MWTPNGEVDGVKTYSGVGKLPSARGDGMIPFPANLLLELFTDVQRSKEFDELFDTGRTVDRVDEQVGAGMVCSRCCAPPATQCGSFITSHTVCQRHLNVCLFVKTDVCAVRPIHRADAAGVSP